VRATPLPVRRRITRFVSIASFKELPMSAISITALRSWWHRRFANGVADPQGFRTQPRLEELEVRCLPSALHMDLDTKNSPVAAGYTGVPVVAYSKTRGYGWTSVTGLSAIDRGTSDPLTSTFHSGQDNTYRVDLPNGTYPVMATMGDAKGALSNVEILQGKKVLASGLSTSYGQFIQPIVTVPNSVGHIALEFKNLAGSSASFAVDGIDILATAPVVNAGPNQTVNEGVVVQFNGTATHGSATSLVSYNWNFGDGATATGLTPTHTYGDDGTYTVTFSVTDMLGLVGTSSMTVTVLDVPPIATIVGAPPSGHSPQGTSISLTSTASSPSQLDRQAGYTYAWTVTKDGAPFATSNQNKITFTPDDEGTYVVTLAVQALDGGINPVQTTIIGDNVAPTPLPGGPYEGTTASPFNFLASATDPSTVDTAAGFIYSWNFGDGSTGTGVQPAHVYSATGTYTVTLTATDEDGVSATATTTATVDVPGTIRSTTGVFSIGISDSGIDPGALANANVDGVLLRTEWNVVEPTAGTYNWSYLDGQVAAAAASGKKVSLVVKPGANTPTWVYAGGAVSFSYTDPKSGLPAAMPLPWDPVFLADWTQFIQALGVRYGSWAALTQVKVTGINMSSEETNLPNTSTDTTDWQAAGYTRVKVENAWQTIADAYSQAFPEVKIALIVVPNAFPPIDDNGNIFYSSGGGDPALSNYLINLGISRYGQQFIVQNNGLSDYWISSQVIGAASQVTTGYQMLYWVTNDNTYRMDSGTPIDIATELQNAVTSGVNGGALFLEIYQTDILNSYLAGVIANAHTSL
jgi:PKD repeat protein